MIIKLYYIYIHYYDNNYEIHHYEKIYNNNDFHFKTNNKIDKWKKITIIHKTDCTINIIVYMIYT